MIRALCVLALASVAIAAPYHHDREPSHPLPYPLAYYQPSEAFGDDMFDTARFWRDLSRQMMAIQQTMQYLHSRFPTTRSSEVYEDGKYKITIPLSGFTEDDITVKAKDSLLMVQAVHNAENNKNTYIDARTLPANVDEHGSWSYDGNVLIITFPTISKKSEEGGDKREHESTNSGAQESTESDTNNEVSQEDNKQTDNTNTERTHNNDVSREEMDLHQTADNNDADVGLKNTEHVESRRTTESAPIQPTTYSVDVKDEVEFVPIKY